MKTLKQLEEEKEEIERQIEELKQKEEVVFDNGEIKIIKWENKPYKDFEMPEGYEWADYFKLVKLINEGKLDFDKNHRFLTKTYFKRDYWDLRGVYLDDDLDVGADGGSWSDSDGDSRVVIQKIKKDLK